MRAEVAVYTKWSNEEDVWPAKKGFRFEYGISRKKS